MDGQTLNTSIEIGPNGERYAVESFRYTVGGEQREQSRTIPLPDEATDPREIEFAAIVRDHGKACADLAVTLASEIGATFTRAKDLLVAMGDESYRHALRAHVESLRVAVKARRAARAAETERAALLERKNRYIALVRNTRDAIEREEDLLRRAAKLTRKPTGLEPHRRKVEELRETLAKQETALEAARAELAAYDAKAPEAA